ncbi:MAG: citrate (Si)-synthase [Calditrichaeota bacterium]|nr:citrate (Si)-synthase [Calditrichota bacterium]
MLKERLQQQIPRWRQEMQTLIRHHGAVTVDAVSVEQLYRGMRGVRSIVCDTSFVDPQRGLFIRGRHISELTERLPEEIFYLLCSGELPDASELQQLQNELRSRQQVPDYIWQMVRQLPGDSQPMAIFSLCWLAMEHESVFLREYRRGLPRERHWEATLEDALNILAKAPVIAAGIYRLKYHQQEPIPPRSDLDWGANYAYMLGLDTDLEVFQQYIRKYLIVHSDHEGGNVTVNSSRIVNSALSDLYFSISAGINGLAGPIHGMANQESVQFAQSIYQHFHGIPTDVQLEQYIWDYLDQGKIIPGFGHAVLRDQDPRFQVLHRFGREVGVDNALFQIIDALSRVVPPILKKIGKVKDPYPNIDAISGVLLYHFGMTEMDYYPVLFALAQIMGISAQIIVSRALMLPIFRPRSVTTEWLKQHVESIEQGKTTGK